MSPKPSCDASLETQSEIFNRAFIVQTSEIAARISKVFSKEKEQKVDMTDCPWMFVYDERNGVDALKQHVFEKDWENFELFFRNEKDLFLFIEEPVVGLLSSGGKFWLFFDPKIANAYFNKQQERPKNFSGSAITKFPHPQILPALTHEIQTIIKESDKRVMAQIKKLEEVLNMADFYLPPEESEQFMRNIRKVIQTLALAEIRYLKNDLQKPGLSPAVLEKRINSIYRLSSRLYARKGDEKQESALKTLLSAQPNVRRQALERVEQKLAHDTGH